jgi:hypothetical protein
MTPLSASGSNDEGLPIKAAAVPFQHPDHLSSTSDSMSNIHRHPHSRSSPHPHGARRRKPPRQLDSFLSFILGFALACVSILSFLGPSLLLRNFDLHSLSFASLLGTSTEKKTPGKYSAKRIQKLESRVAAQVENANKVKSCRRFEKEGDQQVFGSKCKEKLRLFDPRQRFIVLYNPLSYDRLWCSRKIPAKTALTITEQEANELCKEPPIISKIKPTAEGTDMPPIHLMSTGGEFYQLGLEAQDFPCDVGCKYTPFEADMVRYYKVEGMDLLIKYSMESAQHYPELEINEEAYRRNMFYATTSFRSEIPLPYFSWAEYNISSAPVQYNDAIRGASFLARNCDSMSNREEIVKHLMKTTRVDSLSSCLHNADPPNGIDDGGLEGKIAIMRSYLFHLAFENSNEEDYVTEKLWGTLQAGTLPIYYGAANVKEHAPPNSIISWHDFKSTKELANYMNKVAKDKALYDSYHEWRTKPLPKSFREKFDFTKTHSVCRMCRWAYAKRYGFGWDHKRQTVQNVSVPREVKYAMSGKIIQPFRESWIVPKKGAGWSLTATEHDGVLDLHFESMPFVNGTGLYRMGLPLSGEFRADESSRNVFTLQNDKSRFTFLTSWDAQVSSPRPDSIDIAMEPSYDSLRVRLIIENVDTFRPGADKIPSYFGKFWTREFFSPIEAFIVEGKHKEVDFAAQ